MNGRNRHAAVTDELDGARLDQALSSLLSGHSRSFLARLVEEGKVRVDGLPILRPSHRVTRGAAIDVEIPEPVPSTAASQDLPLQFIYQDEDIAVIDKPPGLVVHPAAGHADHTLVNALLFHLDSLSGIGGVIRPGIVHRLDKDTSGVLLVAKNDESHRKLTSLWGTDAIRKEYLALVYGTPTEDRGKIDAPIGRDPRNRKKMAAVAGGRAALTLWSTSERLRYVSLLRCELKSGRTHQIRVHLKLLGHPIVSDALYGGPQWKGIPDRRIQKLVAAFPRQALHATSLSFPHPRSGKTMTFTAPLPDDLGGLLEALRA
jgi:23S rRNA pseudouridine1911/1915/1917 synthase